MPLLYKAGSPAFRGTNIRVPLTFLLGGDAYTLALYPSLTDPNKSVLVIKMILQFQFTSGPGGDWTAAEKDAFAHRFVDSVIEVWNDKFRITTPSTVPAAPFRDVGVQFEFPYYIDGWHTDDDFELEVTKIKPGDFATSSVHHSLGDSDLDSEDNTPVSKGGPMNQRGSVHEFGHMLGLRDEYSTSGGNPNYLADNTSVMHSGELVRARHYAPFAGWLTEQYKVAAHLSGSPIVYKVAGSVDMSNASL